MGLLRDRAELGWRCIPGAGGEVFAPEEEPHGQAVPKETETHQDDNTELVSLEEREDPFLSLSCEKGLCLAPSRNYRMSSCISHPGNAAPLGPAPLGPSLHQHWCFSFSLRGRLHCPSLLSLAPHRNLCLLTTPSIGVQ